jgi:hypothetical protein
MYITLLSLPLSFTQLLAFQLGTCTRPWPNGSMSNPGKHKVLYSAEASELNAMRPFHASFARQIGSRTTRTCLVEYSWRDTSPVLMAVFSYQQPLRCYEANAGCERSQPIDGR